MLRLNLVPRTGNRLGRGQQFDGARGPSAPRLLDSFRASWIVQRHDFVAYELTNDEERAKDGRIGILG